MTCRLSDIRTVGAWRIATLDDCRVHASACGRRIAGTGTKSPIAILMSGPGGVLVRSPDGAPIDAAEIDALLPGALSRFVETASRDTLAPEEDP